MAESDEHAFLKTQVPKVLSEFAALQLYGYSEADRKLFDMACVIERDWHRPLVGQVLWGHGRGVDKDLRTLLTDSDADIKVIVARDEVKYRAVLSEAVQQYRRSGKFQDLFKLRILWVPHDFKASTEASLATVANTIREQVVDDLLFNVVFGHLTPEDVRLFVSASGMPAVNLALLHLIATSVHENYSGMSELLDISVTPIREKLELLKGIGFVSTPAFAIDFRITHKGRVFLELLRCINRESQLPAYSEELTFILTRLGCPPLSQAGIADEPSLSNNLFVGVARTLDAGIKRWGIDFESLAEAMAYADSVYETPPFSLGGRSTMA